MNVVGVGVVLCKEWVLVELIEFVFFGRVLGRGFFMEGV